MRLHHSQNILKMKRSHGLTINQNPLLSSKPTNNWNPLNQHSTLKMSHGMIADKPSHPHQKALEVDQSGVPDCAKKFNPQIITSLSPGRAPAPKGGSNVTEHWICSQTCHTNLLIVYSLYISSVFTLLTAVFSETVHLHFFHLHYLSCIFSNCIRAIS